MLPPQFHEHTRRLVQVNLDAQPSFWDGMAQLDRDEAARGFSLPGPRRGPALELLKRKADTSAEIVWNAIREVHQAMGQPVGDSLQADLINAFDTNFAHVENVLVDTLHHVVDRMSQHPERESQQLEAALRQAKTRRHVAIDLYVESLMSRAPVASDAAPVTTFNIHAPVGAIQTGNNSVANIHQGAFGEADLATLISALHQATMTIISAPRDALDTGHLLGIAAEATEIIKAPNPDRSRLRQVFEVLSSGIQGIASAPQAYQALVSALAVIG